MYLIACMEHIMHMVCQGRSVVGLLITAKECAKYKKKLVILI